MGANQPPVSKKLLSSTFKAINPSSRASSFMLKLRNYCAGTTSPRYFKSHLNSSESGVDA
jgi:hypothetical protein